MWRGNDTAGYALDLQVACHLGQNGESQNRKAAGAGKRDDLLCFSCGIELMDAADEGRPVGKIKIIRSCCDDGAHDLVWVSAVKLERPGCVNNQIRSLLFERSADLLAVQQQRTEPDWPGNASAEPFCRFEVASGNEYLQGANIGQQPDQSSAKCAVTAEQQNLHCLIISIAPD